MDTTAVFNDFSAWLKQPVINNRRWFVRVKGALTRSNGSNQRPRIQYLSGSFYKVDQGQLIGSAVLHDIDSHGYPDGTPPESTPMRLPLKGEDLADLQIQLESKQFSSNLTTSIAFGGSTNLLTGFGEAYSLTIGFNKISEVFAH